MQGDIYALEKERIGTRRKFLPISDELHMAVADDILMVFYANFFLLERIVAA